MKISISIGKKEIKDFIVDENDTVQSLKIKFHDKYAKYHPNRQSFKYQTQQKEEKIQYVRLEDNSKTLKDYQVTENTTLIFKVISNLKPPFES